MLWEEYPVKGEVDLWVDFCFEVYTFYPFDIYNCEKCYVSKEKKLDKIKDKSNHLKEIYKKMIFISLLMPETKG